MILAGYSAGAQVTQEDFRRVDELANNSGLVYNGTVRPVWIGDSHFFWYLNPEPQGGVFYLVNAENGKKEKAFDAEKLADALAKLAGEQVHAATLPFVRIEYQADRKGLDFEAYGKTWHYNLKTNKLTRTGEIPGQQQSRADKQPDKAVRKILSPDKQWEAYSKDNNVYVRDVADNKEYALSRDGMKGLSYNSDLVWSPDSKKLAGLKVRDVQERRIPLLASSPADQKQPVLEWRDYAKPGDVLPVYLPVLFDVVTKQQMPLDIQPFENQFYLHLTGWRADSRAFTFEFNQRGHQRYVVAEVNAGDGNIRSLIDEKSPTFIHYGRNYRYDLNDGKEIVWMSERDGWRHLYLIDGETGVVKNQITKGEWIVRKVIRVDDQKRTLLFTASGRKPGEDPYHIHYCRINLDGSGFVDLTPENGNHIATFSKNGRYFVDAYSRPDLPPVSLLKESETGVVVRELQRADIKQLQAIGWQMPEVFCAKGRDGKTDIWGNILRPAYFDTTKSYPVVEMIYAGPHDSHVDKDFKAYHHLASRLSGLGFVVVMIDGMGTANRSKAFHDICWKNLKDAGFPDRIAWMKAAAQKYPYMDTTRVGIYGWSAGGQNAMAALLFHNDFYKVAVALCGCHDNRMDKIWWNEQWMGYPVDESYAASSNVDNAWRLKGKLLLINGELDDNVDPASTLQVVDALVKAEKDFEQLYLPNRGHSLGGKFEVRRIHDFFVKNLLNQAPPEWK